MNNPRRIAIVLHGDQPLQDDILLWTNESDLVIAADGAADFLMSVDITPDVVIGDMDGIRADTLQELEQEASILFREEQTNTDFQKALRYALSHLPESIAVLNYEGSRVDHMLSALFSEFDRRVKFIGADSIATKLATGSYVLRALPGIRLSLIPLAASAVSYATGLLYDPVGVEFGIGTKDGISNVATGGEVALTIDYGSFLIFVQRFEDEERW